MDRPFGSRGPVNELERESTSDQANYRHSLRIGSIGDLIGSRRKHDHDIVTVSETTFNSGYGGAWRAVSHGDKAVGNRTVPLVGARILAALGVHEIVLLTTTARTPVALAGYGLTIVGQRPPPGLA